VVVERAELGGRKKKEPLEVVRVPAALPLWESAGEIGISRHSNFFTFPTSGSCQTFVFIWLRQPLTYCKI